METEIVSTIHYFYPHTPKTSNEVTSRQNQCTSDPMKCKFTQVLPNTDGMRNMIKGFYINGSKVKFIRFEELNRENKGSPRRVEVINGRITLAVFGGN